MEYGYLHCTRITPCTTMHNAPNGREVHPRVFFTNSDAGGARARREGKTYPQTAYILYMRAPYGRAREDGVRCHSRIGRAGRMVSLSYRQHTKSEKSKWHKGHTRKLSNTNCSPVQVGICFPCRLEYGNLGAPIGAGICFPCRLEYGYLGAPIGGQVLPILHAPVGSGRYPLENNREQDSTSSLYTCTPSPTRTLVPYCGRRPPPSLRPSGRRTQRLSSR